MKQYILTEEQRILLMNAFSQVIAQMSFQPLLLLNQLPEAEKKDG